MGELQTIFDLLGKPEFWAGAMLGLVGAGLLYVATSLLRKPTTGWGLVFTLAVLSGLVTRFEVDPGLLTLLVVIVAAGLVVDVAYSSSARRVGPHLKVGAWAVVVVAVWLAAGAAVNEPSWALFGLPLVIVALGLGLWGLGRVPEREMAGPLMAITIAGAWVTVPETDRLVVMLGAAVPMGLVTLRSLRGRASAAGALGLAATFSWLVLEGGLPRPWTVAAAWTAAGLIPVLALILHRARPSPGLLLILVTQLVYVAAVTRVADFTESATVVLVAFVMALVLATLAVVVVPGALRVDEPVP